MIASRHDLRPLWIAILAMLGLVSAVGDASACSTTPRACCDAEPTAACLCCDETPLPAPAPVSVGLATVAGSHLQSPARPCECRVPSPSAPDAKQDSKSYDQRPDDSPGELSTSVEPTRPASTILRWILCRTSPPEAPLYLLNSRLNI